MLYFYTFAKTFPKPFLCAKKMLQSYKSACTKKDIPKAKDVFLSGRTGILRRAAFIVGFAAVPDLLRADVIHEQGRLQNGCSAYALFYLDIQHVLDSTGLFLEQLERQAVGQLHPFFGLALDVMDTLDSKHFPEDFGHILDNDAEMMSLSRFIVFWRGHKLHATLEPDHLEMTIFFLAARFYHAEDFLKKIFGPFNISHRHGAVFQIRLSCHVFTFFLYAPIDLIQNS